MTETEERVRLAHFTSVLAAFALAWVAIFGASSLSAAQTRFEIATGVAAVVVVAALAARALARGRRSPAVPALMVGGVLLGVCLGVVFLFPFLFPALAQLALIAVAVVMPSVDGFALRLTFIGSWLAAVVTALVGATAGASPEVPRLVSEALQAVSVATTSTLVLQLLWQFNARRRQQLAALASTNTQLEAEVLARTVELKRSEESLLATLNSIGDAVIATDLEGRVVRLNRVAAELTAWAPNEALGHPIHDVFHLVDEDSHLAVEAPVAEVLKERKVVALTRHTLLLSRDGTERPIATSAAPIRDEGGGVCGVVLVFRDQTTERRTEADLRAQHHQLVEAQAIAQLGNWEWNLVTNAIAWSDELYRIFGREPTDVVPSYEYFLESAHPEDRDRVNDVVQNAIRQVQPFAFDYRIIRPDHSVRIVHACGQLKADSTGRAVRALGTAQDVTERKQLEARVLLSDRMASVGTLAGGVAHEINNPLAFVSANLDFIRESVAATTGADRAQHTELMEVIDEARQGTERMRRIVRDLKAFSRADDDVLTAVDVHGVLNLSVNMAFNEIRHRAQLVTDYQDVPSVRANDSRLSQVFVNLLVNAAQAIKVGQADANVIRVSTRREGADRVVVEVQDTGCGMSPSTRERIFDPFFTTKPVGVGTGLGLSICHSIIKGFGGQIEVNSRVDHGTTFRVSLLVARDEDQVVADPEPRQAAEPVRRGRVLVIDDEAMFGAAVQRALAAEHHVEVFTRAQDALARLGQPHEVDVILCDLMMPEMTGVDFRAELSRWAPEQADRVIFMTGGAFTDGVRDFVAQTREVLLEKPLDTSALRQLVREQVDRRRAANPMEPPQSGQRSTSWAGQ